MFRTELLSIIRSTDTVFTAIVICHTIYVDCLSETCRVVYKVLDRMTVHRNTFLVNKTNRCTEFQFYWYYDSKCLGQPFLPIIRSS